MPLDEWQDQVFETAMGERADGRWASKFVGISAPRQNGKSQLIVARALAGVLLFGEKMIIISAHETDTAREIWKRMIDVVESNPSVEARVTGRMDAINREFLSFGKGQDKQTIKLKARRSSGARGFSADCLLLDEAQILGKSAWGSIVPTMSARKNPQMWLFGTPPTDLDDPFAFSRVRSSARANKARHAWLEWAASPDDDFDSPETWAKSNPAYGVRISAEACADDRSAMDDEQFAMERLGIWSDDMGGVAIIAADKWRDAVAEGPGDGAPPLALAVDQSHQREVSIAAAWAVDDGLHVEEVWAGDPLAASAWLADHARRRMPVLIDAASPAAALVPELKRRRMRVVSTSAADMARGCELFLTHFTSGLLTHAGQEALATAVAGAKSRPIRDAGGWGWDRRDQSTNIAPLVAATLATLGAVQIRRPSTTTTTDDAPTRRRVRVLN